MNVATEARRATPAGAQGTPVCSPRARVMATSDLELLSAWRDGQSRAGQRLFERHFAAIYRFFRNKVPNVFDAEDLTQTTFIACVEHADRFAGKSSFRTFLFGIAHHKLLNFYRSRGRRERRIVLESASAIDLGAGPPSIVSRKEERHLVLEGLRSIPLELQIVLELFYWESMTGAEIADALGIPLGTARSRLRRGKRALREWLENAPRPERLLDSTLHNLEEWARSIKAEIQPEPR